MSGTDSPETGSGNDTALSVDQGAAAIENLLSSVPDDEDQQDSAASEESKNEDQDIQSDSVSTEASDDGDEGLEFDDETTDASTDAPKEPEFKAGQFAAHDAKVKLEDGTTISVSELIAGNMFQRKFTEKTMALAEEKKALDVDRHQFADTKNQIEHQRNVILTLASKLLPKEPAPVDAREDPAGYLEYLAERDAYNATMGELNTLWQATQQEQEKAEKAHQEAQKKAADEQQEQMKKMLQSEAAKFFEAIPRLKDPEQRAKFRAEAVEIGGSVYGITQEEIDSIPDHRYLRILADAIAFRKAVAKRDAGKQPQPNHAQKAQQPRIQQRQRMAPSSQQAKEASTAIDRLRKTGSINDAAKALEKFV